MPPCLDLIAHSYAGCGRHGSTGGLKSLIYQCFGSLITRFLQTSVRPTVIHAAHIFHHHYKLEIQVPDVYPLSSSNPNVRLKGIAMTSLALDIVNRSATFFGSMMDALEKAIAMMKAVRHDNPSAADLKKVRAIADTI